jgi:hypothetical protein
MFATNVEYLQLLIVYALKEWLKLLNMIVNTAIPKFHNIPIFMQQMHISIIYISSVMLR